MDAQSRLATRQRLATLATEIESLQSQISKLKLEANAKQKEMGDLKRSLRTAEAKPEE